MMMDGGHMAALAVPFCRGARGVVWTLESVSDYMLLQSFVRTP
jgi:hypothetical protein